MSSRISRFDSDFATGAANPGAGGAATRFFDALILWHDRARERRDLAALDDRMLRDIGVSRAEAEAEARKPFWRL